MTIKCQTRDRPDCFEIPEEGPKKGVPTQVESTDPYPHGNGCWRMTASDLLAFRRAIHQHHVLITEDSFQTMVKYQGEGRFGFWVDRDPATRRTVLGYGHPGGGPGMSSFLHTWQTNPPITAVVLSNYSGCQDVKPELDKLMHQ